MSDLIGRRDWLANSFGVAPRATADAVELIRTISATCLTLVARQERAGNWGHRTTLEELICTCHATMALEAAGYSLEDPALRRARDWLQSGEATSHNNSYWIVAPLLPWLDRSSELKALLSQQMRKLETAINHGAQPHPDQYSLTFYLRVATAIPDAADKDAMRRYLDVLRTTWSSSEGWAKRADTTTSCYGAIALFDKRFSDRIASDVVKLLDVWSEAPETGHIKWRSPISTAYTVINLVETGLIQRPDVRALADNAIAWLLSLRAPDGLWDSEVPFGGTGDIKAREYAAAVIVRAFVAYASIDVPSVQGAVSALRIVNLRSRIVRLRVWRALWFCVAFGLSIFVGAPFVDLSALPSPGVDKLGIVIGVLGLVIAIGHWAFPSALRSVWPRVRRLWLD